MADYVINASFVAWISGERPVKAVAGESLTAGDILYRDFSDFKRLKKADSNEPPGADVIGLALGSASTGGPVWYAPRGCRINPGIGSADTGESIYLSETAGKMRPQSDVAVGVGSINKVVLLGLMENFGVMQFRPHNTGVDYFAWSIEHAGILSTDLDISGKDSALKSFDFNGASGTKVFALGDTNDKVYEYALSTAWDVSTGTFTQDFSVATQTTSPTAVRFGDSGTKMYVSGGTTVYQYTLPTAYSLTGASYASKSYDTTAETTAVTSLFLSYDGDTLFVTDNVPGAAVYQYTLSTPWDISTASYASKSLSVSSEESNPQGLWFKPDGWLLYVCGTGSNAVFTYRMTTQWDVSTGAYISGGDTKALTNPQDIALNQFGDRLYNANGTDDDIEQFEVS